MFRYPIAFSYMCVGCVLTYPATLAVQAQTFSEYIIRGTKTQFGSGLEDFWAKKCLSFSLICTSFIFNWFLYVNNCVNTNTDININMSIMILVHS